MSSRSEPEHSIDHAVRVGGNRLRVFCTCGDDVTGRLTPGMSQRANAIRLIRAHMVQARPAGRSVVTFR